MIDLPDCFLVSRVAWLPVNMEQSRASRPIVARTKQRRKGTFELSFFPRETRIPLDFHANYAPRDFRSFHSALLGGDTAVANDLEALSFNYIIDDN